MSSYNSQETISRINKVRAKFNEWQIDALLIENSSNRRWLSGFTGSSGWLLLTSEEAFIATDSRYWEQAADQSPVYELVKLRGNNLEAIVAFLEGAGTIRIGLEADHITLNQFKQFESIKSNTWVPLDQVLSSFRQYKDDSEIEIIRHAAAITDLAMQQVNSLVRIGMTESELAWELEKIMREAGATSTAFSTIVASGPNSARPHHESGSRAFTIGDCLIIDMGARVDGYCSDMTRPFFIGNSPTDKFWEIYHTVLEAQETALSNMVAGMSGRKIDSLAREVINRAGYKEAFGHSLGHGLGLEVHENPRLSQLAEDTPVGTSDGRRSVVTVEPGIYLADWGGIRIEDLVLLGESGVELLSKCPKDPIIPA